MAKLADRVENALNECRILILGAEVLLGFQYRSTFESGFDKLPRLTQDLKVAGLALILVAVGLLIVPSSYHRLVERGEDSARLHRFTSRVATLALLPFAVSLGIDLYVATEKLFGQMAGAIAGVVGSGLALGWWYGYEVAERARLGRAHVADWSQERGNEEDEVDQHTKLSTKIKQVLTEARTVLPGAQALLGFQFASMLVEGFDKLPQSSKNVHLASLACIALATIILMSPAAYHRIVEEGEDSERVHRFASRMVVAALVPLALGIAGDLYVVVAKVLDSTSAGVGAALLALAFLYGLWFGLTLFVRRRRQAEDPTPRQQPTRLAA